MTAASNAKGEERQRSFSAMVTKAINFIDLTGAVVSMTCLTLLFFALLANVILRYTMGSGIIWAYEIHAVLLPWLVAGGIVVAAARGRNISITLLPAMLSSSAVRILSLIIFAIILVISVSVLWTSKPILMASKFQSLSTLGIKQIWGYSSLVYAFGGMALIAALDILRVLTDKNSDSKTLGESSLS